MGRPVASGTFFQDLSILFSSLKQLGFNRHFATEAERYGIGQPYRVTEDFGLRFVVAGETHGQISQFNLHFARKPTQAPIIGDWIVGLPMPDGNVEFVDILPRQNCFQRSNQGEAIQPLAANLDRLFIVTSCTSEFNLSRLERYLLLARANHIEPVIVLNKIDLVADPADHLAQIAELGRELAVCLVSTVSAVGMMQLKTLISEGSSCVFVGSSGVGKSSLVNALLGFDQQYTLAVSAKGARGAHTTTSRSLYGLVDHGVIIDTPGIRSVGVSADASHLHDTFDDIAQLMAQCAFRNCHHNGEAGCAIAVALETGKLSQRRLDSYRKLQREAAFFDDKAQVQRRLRNEGKQRAARRISRERFERNPK